MPTPTQPIFIDSQWDDATITASETASGFAVANLQKHGTRHRWESVNVTGAKWIQWEVLTARTVTWAHAHYHNGTSAGTFQWRFANTSGALTASPLLDSGVLPCWQTTDMDVQTWKTAAHFYAAGVSCKFARLDFTDGANPEGRLRLARAVLANATQCGFFPHVGSDFASGRDHSLVERSSRGFESAAVQEPKDEFHKQWFTYDKAEAERLWRLWKKVGTSRDVSAVANPVSTTLADLNLGIFRFPEEFRIRFENRMSETSGRWTANLNLRGV